MLYALWSPKGGSGTSVVCAALGSFLARRRPTLLVDLDGDLPAIAGSVPSRSRPPVSSYPYPTLAHWLAAGPMAETDALDDLVEPVGDRLGLLPLGARILSMTGFPAESGAALAVALGGGPTVVVDAGRAEHHIQRALVEVADASVMVVRGCYLALRRAVDDDLTARARGVVVVEEAGRALGPVEVADVLGCPVLATVRVAPSIARAVDAGLLIHRPPKALIGPLRSLVEGLDGSGRPVAEPGGSGWAA